MLRFLDGAPGVQIRVVKVSHCHVPPPGETPRGRQAQTVSAVEVRESHRSGTPRMRRPSIPRSRSRPGWRARNRPDCPRCGCRRGRVAAGRPGYRAGTPPARWSRCSRSTRSARSCRARSWRASPSLGCRRRRRSRRSTPIPGRPGRRARKSSCRYRRRTFHCCTSRSGLGDRDQMCPPLPRSPPRQNRQRGCPRPPAGGGGSSWLQAATRRPTAARPPTLTHAPAILKVPSAVQGRSFLSRTR